MAASKTSTLGSLVFIGAGIVLIAWRPDLMECVDRCPGSSGRLHLLLIAVGIAAVWLASFALAKEALPHLRWVPFGLSLVAVLLVVTYGPDATFVMPNEATRGGALGWDNVAAFAASAVALMAGAGILDVTAGRHLPDGPRTVAAPAEEPPR